MILNAVMVLFKMAKYAVNLDFHACLVKLANIAIIARVEEQPGPRERLVLRVQLELLGPARVMGQEPVLLELPAPPELLEPLGLLEPARASPRFWATCLSRT